ncbi:cation diffusion facilitator family transporter [Polaromonas sp. P1(28)-13]|nr:cation diffusion facilitator family transporter [Polaromonas sp. P1-6]UUZ76638.1 cation diffusion facilitator family transporter [Polaromonas sp. P1(28)-13]
MSAQCDHHHHHDNTSAATSPRYKKILWIALVVNLAMFAVEIGAGFRSGSVSLLADAIDFFGDAANYGVTLAVLSMGVVWRGRAARLKGASMLAFGLFVMGRALWMLIQGGIPEAFTMGSIGLLALLANGVVAALLYAYREGDANMRSVWLCTRNDALGNVAVMLAALGVFGTGSAWPDLAVATVMAGLALTSGWAVLRQAGFELKVARHART